jgi:hypothetical protein
MKANWAASESEVFLALLVLPARPRDLQRACLGPDSTEPQLQTAPATGQQRVNDETLRDMILHD